MIKDLLEGKTAKEKAQIKAKEIAKLNHIGEYTNAEYGIRIEIQSLKEIEGGIEIFARAWKGNNQLGFGADGSVEWERFLIYNPPILVNDPNGTIINTYKKGTGEIVERKLREDPIEAIRQTLTHTIKVSAKEGINIVKGKRGSTTSTFYPDPDPEVTSVDGYAARNGVSENWATIRSGAGNLVSSNGAGDVYGMWWNTAAPYDGTLWTGLMRVFVLFDTSSIPDADNITSATLSVFGQGKADPHSNAPNSDVYTSTPASNTDLVMADYSQTGTVSQTGSPITFASWSTTGYNDYTFNATGQSNISKTGVSKFALRNANYDVANVAPVATSNNSTYMQGYAADQIGTANDPKLVVTHSSPTTVTGNSIFFGTNF